MGELYLHNLNHYIERYGCRCFVETGTGKGTGLSHALRAPFSNLYSIEIIKELYDFCVSNFNDSRLTLLNNNSLDGLREILKVLPQDPCLFWLDAHFPGADFHFNSYDHLSENRDLHKPLSAEISLIRSERPASKDVFIIDDLHIYEEGPFELLNKEFRKKYGENGIGFIKEAYEETHNFTRDYRHQGFLILTPK